MGQEIVTLTQAELKKVLVVILDGRMTNREGAEVLGLSIRQIIRLKKRYLLDPARHSLRCVTLTEVAAQGRRHDGHLLRTT
jgi:hypothetical protein